VLAVADGRVAAKTADRLGIETGNYVVIAHASGISSGYAHLSGFNVDLGQRVERGQIVGSVGKTGTKVTYPHLHLNILGGQRSRIGGRTLRYRYDFLQFLSGDMTPIDPAKKRNQRVKVAYMDQFGRTHPPDAEVIWPFVCERKP